jgi:sugar phosphate isomerase/epimerase
MKLAVSSLAWDRAEEIEAFKVLKNNNINYVEVVFSKIKPWDDLTENDIKEYKLILEDNGLQSLSSQSLFYGINLTLSDERDVINHLYRIITYSEILGIKTLVFGSPNMRMGSLSSIENTLHKIDMIFNNHNMNFIIEPNARIYGGEFWYSISEIVDYLGVKFSSIHAMMDLHNSLLEEKDENQDLLKYCDSVRHIHISEPELKPISNYSRHQVFANTIKEINYDGIITYEVLRSNDVLNSIGKFSELYNI